MLGVCVGESVDDSYLQMFSGNSAAGIGFRQREPLSQARLATFACS